MYTMESVYGDLAGKRVADLGCGTGMLSIAAAMFAPGCVAPAGGHIPGLALT